MSVWDELSAKERSVLTNAIEEAALNGVIGDFLGHAESGGALWIGSTNEAAITALIPRFAAVVGNMIRRISSRSANQPTASGTTPRR